MTIVVHSINAIVELFTCGDENIKNFSLQESDSSTDSSDDEDVKTINKCSVCDKPQNSNQINKPELFVQCSKCRRKSKNF